MPCRLRIFDVFLIKMFLQNRTDELIQTALCHEFVPGPPTRKGKAEIFDDGPDCRTGLGKKRMYGDLVVHNIVDMFGTYMIILHENLKVKNDTVVDTGLILRVAAVQRAVCNKDNVALMAGADIVVQRHMKIAGQNTDDFVMAMPVVRHIITRTVGDLMIESDGEVEGSLLSMFLVIKIFHLSCRISFPGANR